MGILCWGGGIGSFRDRRSNKSWVERAGWDFCERREMRGSVSWNLAIGALIDDVRSNEKRICRGLSSPVTEENLWGCSTIWYRGATSALTVEENLDWSGVAGSPTGAGWNNGRRDRAHVEERWWDEAGLDSFLEKWSGFLGGLQRFCSWREEERAGRDPYRGGLKWRRTGSDNWTMS